MKKEEGTSRKIQKQQRNIAAVCLITSLFSLFTLITSVYFNHIKLNNSSSNLLSKKKYITKSEGSIYSYDTYTLKHNETKSAFNDELFVTRTSRLKSVTDSFSVKVNKSEKEVEIYSQLRIGDTIKHDNFEIKVFKITEGIGNYFITFKIKKMIDTI